LAEHVSPLCLREPVSSVAGGQTKGSLAGYEALQFARAAPRRRQPSAIGIFAVLHGMNAQSIAAFFGEAHSEIANAEALLAGRTVKSFGAASYRRL
jgi:hypothetical protein